MERRSRTAGGRTPANDDDGGGDDGDVAVDDDEKSNGCEECCCCCCCCCAPENERVIVPSRGSKATNAERSGTHTFFLRGAEVERDALLQGRRSRKQYLSAVSINGSQSIYNNIIFFLFYKVK